MDRRAEVGRRGEDAAVAAYAARGFRVVARNWRCPLGEIDLVVEREGLLVFCEVKTRSGAAFGGGFEAVTAAKRRKLRALAEAFLATRDDPPPSVRFDVASVRPGRGAAQVELFEDAFGA
ncbi:MAG TPA: YraN family protein [Actinomycetota bacterium]|nr:YraN family protein [Actinomycetota bacterium]